MKRFHVHVGVDDIDQSIRFYSTLFASEPGVRHLGIQVEDSGELDEVYSRLQRADRPVLEEGATTCCYAKSEKSWIEDPQGVKWETFLTSGESTTYGSEEPAIARTTACCEPSVIASPALSRCCA